MRRFFTVLTAIFVVLPTMSLLLPATPRAEAATAGPDIVATVIPVAAARAGGSAAFRVLVRNVGGADASGPVEVQLSPSTTAA